MRQGSGLFSKLRILNPYYLKLAILLSAMHEIRRPIYITIMDTIVHIKLPRSFILPKGYSCVGNCLNRRWCLQYTRALGASTRGGILISTHTWFIDDTSAQVDKMVTAMRQCTMFRMQKSSLR